MHQTHLDRWQHRHTFGQDKKRRGETRTFLVIALTGAMMIIEIAAGILFGSMALLADGLHMASHAVALGISAFAYVYARRHALDPRFSFGTGKVNALGGFTGAVLLAVFALMMAWKSVDRIVFPTPIAFNQAILVAVFGLLVNGVSAIILGDDDHDDHEGGHHHDHNLRAAYLHVLADALTSLLAIFALLAGKFGGLVWMDPVMGLVGAVLVARWALGLLRLTSGVLLDHQAPREKETAIRQALERHDGDRVADLHVWSVGPNIYAAIVAVVAHEPKPPEHYKGLIPTDLGIVHVTVEVHRCPPSATTEESTRVNAGSGP